MAGQAARIIFSGDTRQIQSVEAGDALRILEKESHLKSTSLTQVQQQTAEDYREAIQELRRNPARGFEKLEQIGAIREVAWHERAETVAQAWRAAGSQLNGKGERRNVLVVCGTHEEIGKVTEAIRAERKCAGELGESAGLERLVPQNYTAAQKTEARNFRPGQVLVFHRATKEVDRNEALEVVRVEKDKILVSNGAGGEHELTAKQAKCFEVYERRAIEVAPNDKLVLMANRREAGFRATNGEMVVVSRIDEAGRIQLTDGRILPSDYRHFDYGYAVTAHRSQGKSVDVVVISGDAMKKELFYVAASRGRESLTVVTSDKELLRESVGRSGERQSASELVCKAAQSRPGRRLCVGQSFQRGRDAAYALARQAARQDYDSGMKAPSLQQEMKDQTSARVSVYTKERRRDYGLSR